MTMHTSARDEALIEEIAAYFDILAIGSETMAQRGWNRQINTIRAACWRKAAEDVRSIKLDPVAKGGAA